MQPKGEESGQLRDVTYRAIRRAILDGYFYPGQHLVERHIGEELNLSKTPVREALTRLEEEGLVESSPYRGFFIRIFEEQDVREIYELRELYEGACARMAAAGDGHFEVARRLLALNQAARVAHSKGDIDEVHQQFAKFDDVLFRQTTNTMLREQIDRMRVQIHLSGILTNQIPGRVVLSLDEHGRIIEAISAGEAADAEARMREHVGSLLASEAGRRNSLQRTQRRLVRERAPTPRGGVE
jgi:GntR family transcriptional regulator, rspAB operon transcriptional repressor